MVCSRSLLVVTAGVVRLDSDPLGIAIGGVVDIVSGE